MFRAPTGEPIDEAYGTTGGVFLVITTIKAATELDAEEAQDKQFEEAMGTDGMKKMQELEAACVESRQTNLFVIDPKMSYPPEAWVKADPDFWMPGRSRLGAWPVLESHRLAGTGLLRPEEAAEKVVRAIVPSAAKAVSGVWFCGTTEAVPFVQ